MNFAKFLRTPFLQNTSGRLFLNVAQETFVACKRIDLELSLLESLNEKQHSVSYSGSDMGKI